MNSKLLITVGTLHFIALVSPGPDFVLSLRNTLRHGRLNGFFTGLGFAAGIAVHSAYCMGGIALLLVKEPRLFQAIKLLGAGYIIFLGIQSLLGAIKGGPDRATETVTEIENEQAVSLGKAFTQGFLTNLLNPKATLAILGLFTAVIPVGTDVWNLLASAAIMVGLTLLWFTLVALFFGIKAIRIKYQKMENTLNLMFALLFMMAGLSIIIS
jgi:threonine efflux protein